MASKGNNVTLSKVAPGESRVGGRRKRLSLGRTTRATFTMLPLIALVIWTLLPLITSFSISLKSHVDVLADPGLIPDNPTLAAYGRVWALPGFRTALLNSILTGFGTLALTLLIGVPAAYAFARFRFPGRHLLLVLALVPLFVPGVTLMTPLYTMAVATGVYNTKALLVGVFTAMGLPLAVWLLVGFFQAVPRELEEAAVVDGASLTQVLLRVVLPLALPALITVAILSFREAWNAFDLVLVLTQGPDNRTLPYALYQMETELGIGDTPGKSAFALMTIVPLLIVYVRIERHVVQGILSGAVK